MTHSFSSHTLLHQNEFGYVSLCSCCREIQFVLGNVLSQQSKKGFKNLYRALSRMKDEVPKCLTFMPNGHKVLLKTPATELMLSLSQIEFEQTLALFEQAAIMLEVNELLK